MSSILKVNTIQDAGGNSFLSSNGSGTFTPGSAMATGVLANTPAFEAYLGSNQTVSHATLTKVTINTEVLDSSSAYDHSSNYRFTPQTAGKYFVHANLTMYSTSNNTINGAIIAIYKNGSNYKAQDLTPAGNESVRESLSTSAVIDFNGSSDYVELFGYLDVDSGTPTIQSGDKYTNFGAYKLIGA